MNTILDIFKSITRYDIQQYFEDFATFVLSDYQKIIDFYELNADIPVDVLNHLKSLNSRVLQINDMFSLYNDQLSNGTTEVWELLDYFEATKTTLYTVTNSARWMRSTKNVLQSNVVDRDFILKQGQNFERLSTELGYSDPDNDWSKVALNNDINEEKYTFDGGTKLKISFVNDLSFDVNTVIDSITGLKLYGLDLDKRFVFEGNDFKILGYHDTILQQTTILVGLMKGSVPEFPQDGIPKDLVGSNVNAIQYPILLRQQSAVFEKDNRYKSVAINRLETSMESLIMELTITTKLDEVLNENLVLQ